MERRSTMRRSHSLRQAGFSLVELLVTVGIMIVLMSFTLPSIRGMMDGTGLARAGQIVGDQINLARQLASATNSSVEVRFIQIRSLSTHGFSAVQLWGTGKSGAIVALRNAVMLPRNIVIAGNERVSPAFSMAPTPPSNPLITGTMPAGGGTTAGAPYVAFQIRPTGLVLPVLAVKDFAFSIVPERTSDGTTLPPNYITIQVNPLTASPLIYRP